MKKAVIFGTGSFAEVAYVYLTADSPYNVVAFTANRDHNPPKELLGVPVVPFEELENHYPPGEVEMFVAIGFSKVNKTRTAVVQACKERGYRMLTYICSRATHFGHIEIGENCFIFENNVIQPFVKIGDNTILWSGNHIGHHTHIGDNCFIASHVVISGNCRIGNNVFIGVNATFRDGAKVADDNVIGAGAMILKDTQPGDVYKSTRTEPAPFKSHELRNF